MSLTISLNPSNNIVEDGDLVIFPKQSSDNNYTSRDIIAVYKDRPSTLLYENTNIGRDMIFNFNCSIYLINTKVGRNVHFRGGSRGKVYMDINSKVRCRIINCDVIRKNMSKTQLRKVYESNE